MGLDQALDALTLLVPIDEVVTEEKLAFVLHELAQLFANTVKVDHRISPQFCTGILPNYVGMGWYRFVNFTQGLKIV